MKHGHHKDGHKKHGHHGHHKGHHADGHHGKHGSHHAGYGKPMHHMSGHSEHATHKHSGMEHGHFTYLGDMSGVGPQPKMHNGSNRERQGAHMGHDGRPMKPHDKLSGCMK